MKYQILTLGILVYGFLGLAPAIAQAESTEPVSSLTTTDPPERNTAWLVPILDLLLNDNSALLGPDENSNGVRDDVEAYILSLYPLNVNPTHTYSLFHVARDLRYATSGEHGRLINSFRHIECAFQVHGSNQSTLDLLHEITAQMADNRERLIQYFKSLEYADTSNFALTSDACAGIDLTAPAFFRDSVATPSNIVDVGSVDDGCAPVSDNSVTIYYANGMFNSKVMAIVSRDNLAMLMSMPEESIKLSYQASEFFLLQFLEAAEQRLTTIGSDFLRWMYRLEIAPEWFNDLIPEFIAAHDAIRVRADDDLDQHIEQYKNIINSGSSVVVVGHSQGNLYANEARDYLNGTPELTNRYGKYVKIVAVATPASRVSGGDYDDYTTLCSDTIMAAVRVLTPNTLECNPPNSWLNSPLDMTNHGFVTTYLHFSEIADRIKGQINVAINELSVSPPEDNRNLITLTVSSPNPSSMYVQEPGGNVLDNGATLGQFGTITGTTSYSYSLKCKDIPFPAPSSVYVGINSAITIDDYRYRPDLVDFEANLQVFNSSGFIGGALCPDYFVPESRPYPDPTELIYAGTYFPVTFGFSDGKIDFLTNPFSNCSTY